MLPLRLTYLPAPKEKLLIAFEFPHSVAAGPGCPGAQVRFFKIWKWESTASVSTHA